MGQREKYALLGLLILGAITFLLSVNTWYDAATVPAPAQGGEYSEGLVGQPHFLNPLLATSSTDNALVHLIFSGLYRYDSSGQLTPDLAASMPEVSKDQKQYTIHLRSNVAWHNGQPFTADDVIFTIHTLQNANYKSPLRGQWGNTSVQKIDDHTVVFKTKEVSGPFIHNLTLPIISQAVWGKVAAQNFSLSPANLEAIGTGPYEVKEIKKLPTGKVSSLTLSAFPRYYLGQANISQVTLKFYGTSTEVLDALHGRGIQGTGFVPLDTNLYFDPSDGRITVHQIPLPQYQVALFNLNNKILADPAVRKALLAATDKAQILTDVFRGNGRLLNGPLVPEALGYNASIPAAKYNLGQTNKMLDQAGWTVDNQTGIRTKNKVPIQLKLSTNDAPVNVQAAQILAMQWQKLHIQVQLNILPTKDLTASVIKPRNFDVLLFFQKIGPDPDLFSFWHSSQSKDPGLNVTGFNNPAADKLINEARTTTNLAVRADRYKKLQQVIADQNPAIFLVQSVYVYAIDKSIKGVDLKILSDPAWHFLDLPNWYLAEKRVIK